MTFYSLKPDGSIRWSYVHDNNMAYIPYGYSSGTIDKNGTLFLLLILYTLLIIRVILDGNRILVELVIAHWTQIPKETYLLLFRMNFDKLNL